MLVRPCRRGLVGRPAAGRRIAARSGVAGSAAGTRPADPRTCARGRPPADRLGTAKSCAVGSSHPVLRGRAVRDRERLQERHVPQLHPPGPGRPRGHRGPDALQVGGARHHRHPVDPVLVEDPVRARGRPGRTRSGPDRLLSTGWSIGSATVPRPRPDRLGRGRLAAMPTSSQPPQSCDDDPAPASRAGCAAYASRNVVRGAVVDLAEAAGHAPSPTSTARRSPAAGRRRPGASASVPASFGRQHRLGRGPLLDLGHPAAGQRRPRARCPSSPPNACLGRVPDPAQRGRVGDVGGEHQHLGPGRLHPPDRGDGPAGPVRAAVRRPGARPTPPGRQARSGRAAPAWPGPAGRGPRPA